ncbi:MAG: hypothetical protein Q9213_003613 [Squamulea squamosa]
MSGEAANATQEAIVTSSSKQLPDSHPPPAAIENNDSASTTAQTSPAQTATSNPNQSEPLVTNPTSEQRQPVYESNPSANVGLQPDSTQQAQVGNADLVGQEKSSRRGSKGSVQASSRRGSGVSNKLAKKERIVAPATSSDEKSAEEASDNTPKPKKKAFSRFFSILNCCGGHKDANDLELDPAVPSKRAKTLQSTRSRQTIPVTNPNNASAGDSSNTESKEALEDNIAGKRYSELTPSAQPKIIEPPKKEVPPTEKSPLQSEPVPLAEPKIAPVPSVANDQPLPPLPSDTGNNRDNAMTNTEASDEKPTTIAGDDLVEAPMPPTTGIPQEGVSTEEAAINDRTQQQEAADVEMTEAPPVAPTPEPQAPSPEPSIQSPPQTNFPPPPPPPPPDSARPPVGNRRPSNGEAGEQPKGLLPPIAERFRGKKCLVLDLDETLVHSSFKILHQADFTIPVEIEGQYHNVYVIKRPGVDQFMKRVGELYEVVVFTASVSKYGDPLLDQLDIHNVVHHRLFRESCYNHQGNYVKDLSQVGRDLRETIIIDNSPTSYIFHPQHAVPISSWFSDAHDNELLDLIPVLEDLAGPQVRDVSLVLDVGL